MKNIYLSVILVIALLASGCGVINRTDEIKLASEVPETSEIRAETPNKPQTDVLPAPSADDRLQNLVKDAYPSIEVEAFIRERKAILPGSSIPVTVTVKNVGTEAVDYIQGSGRYETPEAVFMSVDGLQTVLPKDHLGPVTMDFQTKELQPGEELQFVMYVMVIEPDDNFNTYTLEVYKDGEKYIAESDWPGLQKEFPDLIPAKSGSYQGHVYFVYYLRDASGVSDFTKEPSGYAECDFPISVS